MIEMILMDGTFHVEFHLLERLKKKLLNITRVEEMFKFRKGTEASAAPGADAASKKRKMTPLIVAGVVLLLAIVAISTGIVVSKNNANNATASSNSAAAPSSSSGATAQGGSSSASNSTGNTGNGTTTAPNTGIKSNRQLIGYLGANAVANGVDIKNGISARKTDTGDYQRRLAYYCDLGYYGTINLSFMNAFGGQGPWTITFGAFNDTGFISSGTYTYDGTSQTPTVDNGTMTSFYNLGKDVTHCQSKGVKIVMSLGGDHSSPYSFGPGDGEFYANLWYNQFLGGTHPVRPLGPGVQLDGFELDIEKPGYEAEMTIFVTTLRKLCPKCVLAAVPQCILTYGTDGLDQNVGLTINATNGKGILDYVIIQYYNNPPCSYPFGFNFKSWKPLFNGPLYIGLAGDWTSAINGGFMEMPQLQAVYDMVKDDPQFAGWSVYDVSSSTPPAKYWNVENYANPSTSNYSQVLSGILQGTPAWTGVQLPPQGPVAQDGLNTTYRCASTWIWANTQCSLEDCYDAVAKGGDPEKVCGGNTQCNQMVVKC